MKTYCAEQSSRLLYDLLLLTMLLDVQVVSSKIKASAELPQRQDSFSVSTGCKLYRGIIVEVGIFPF